MNQNGEVVILHISDLHRTPGSELSNGDLWGALRQDVEHGFKQTNSTLASDEPRLPLGSEIDLVIVSGDLTQQAGAAEYVEAEELLDKIAHEFVRGDHHRVLIVPGNHDITWRSAKAAYQPVEHPTPEMVREAYQHESRYRLDMADPLHPVLYERDHDTYYADCLANFATSLARFYDNQYAFPLNDRTHQYVLFDKFVEELGVVVVGFSSCDLVDHLWRRGTIHREAILNASQELDSKGYRSQDVLRIAVWHHNIFGNPEQMDFMDPRTAILLAQHGYTLGLHGHVHGAGRVEVLGRSAALPVVWAGSLAAGSSERPPSIPLLYNVIGLNRTSRRAWIHVRKRNDENEAWEAYTEWSEKHRSWYAVDFATDEAHAEVRLFRHIGESHFLDEIVNMIEQSEEITWIGTGLNVLMQKDIRELIVQRAREGKLRATICFGNPFSPHVQDRFIEEERSEVKPDVAAVGIVRRVASLLEMIRDVPAVQVKLFDNYPTLAVFRFSNGEYFSYPMGYRKLGNRCPVICVSRTSIYSAFLDEMINKYLEDAVDANEVFRIKERNERNKNFIDPSNVRAVALYILPENTALSQAAMQLIGSDSTGTAIGETDDEDLKHFRAFAGAAFEYGFHVTVADVMYVPVTMIPSLVNEIRHIASRVRPFSLAFDTLSEGNSPPYSLEVLCSEVTGELEKLLAEVTVRIRPRSLGTNYTLDTSHAPALADARAQTFCEAYQSPYVLSGFRPHFTIAKPATIPSEEDRTRLRETTTRMLGPYFGRLLDVDRLFFLQKAVDAPIWEPITDANVIALKRP